MARQEAHSTAKPERIAQAFGAIRTASAERIEGINLKRRILEVA